MTTAAVRHRTMRVLVTSQVLAAVGTSSGIAVGGLLARSLLPSDALAGFAQAGVTLGAALAAVPVSRLMARRGRRPGLAAAYAAAALGALTALVGAWTHLFWLLVVGMLVFGSATAGSLLARYAATDLAPPLARARALAVVVWATTVGAVLGPNLAGLVDEIGGAWGLPAYGAPFVLSALVFLAAALVVVVFLRPDPLVLAGGTRDPGTRHVPLRHSLAVVLSSSPGRVGLAAMAVGQTVMVAVMTMTPLQMRHAAAELRLVGLVISVHILGMYALSPVVGAAADRWGRRRLLVAGALTLLAALAIAGGAAPNDARLLSVGLFLLGLGWNATLVGGSTLLVDVLPVSERAAAQGAADMVMTGTGGLGGALSGFVMVAVGYAGLAAAAAVLVVALLGALAVRAPARPRAQASIPD